MTILNWSKITTYYLTTDEGNYRKTIATDKWEKNQGIWRSEELWEEVLAHETIKSLDELLEKIIKSESLSLFDYEKRDNF